MNGDNSSRASSCRNAPADRGQKGNTDLDYSPDFSVCPSRKSSAVSGTCFRLFATTSIIHDLPDHFPLSPCFLLSCLEMTYEGMLVANGQDAGVAWESLVRGSLDQDERTKIEKALRDYCGQDTLALVRLFDKLRMIGRSDLTLVLFHPPCGLII